MVHHFALWIMIMMEAKPKCAQMNITEDGGIHGLFGAHMRIWMGYTTMFMNQIRPESFGFNLTVISLLKKYEWWYENHNGIWSMEQITDNQLCFHKKSFLKFTWVEQCLFFSLYCWSMFIKYKCMTRFIALLINICVYVYNCLINVLMQKRHNF